MGCALLAKGAKLQNGTDISFHNGKILIIIIINEWLCMEKVWFDQDDRDDSQFSWSIHKLLFVIFRNINVWCILMYVHSTINCIRNDSDQTKRSRERKKLHIRWERKKKSKYDRMWRKLHSTHSHTLNINAWLIKGISPLLHCHRCALSCTTNSSSEID